MIRDELNAEVRKRDQQYEKLSGMIDQLRAEIEALKKSIPALTAARKTKRTTNPRKP